MFSVIYYDLMNLLVMFLSYFLSDLHFAVFPIMLALYDKFSTFQAALKLGQKISVNTSGTTNNSYELLNIGI